ncbi:MAG TPA: AMP-binding protein [Thermomicrobiales bacterium]|nr:AMP-binding protein [Thermomicrobiales bacterium]
MRDHAAAVDQRDVVVWQPEPHHLERSRLIQLCRATGNDTPNELRAWAASDVGRYWDTVVRDLDLQWHRPYNAPLDLSRGKPWPEWFVGGGFNYVTNALDRHADGPHAAEEAMVWEDEDGHSRSFTWRELREEADRLSHGLVALGVAPGDRVGIFLPMIPETVIAVLACGKIGAVYIPLFSGFGEDAVASRLNDCSAVAIITADAFPRRGKQIPLKAIADAALRRAPSVKTCIVYERTGTDVSWNRNRDHWWHDVVTGHDARFDTLPTAANDPYMVIYTSGTTGRPKGTVHVHAGFPIKAAHDLAYCFDLHPDDRLFWLTDLGWMMGPWMIAGALMLGSTLVIYEGTPDYPAPDRLWQLVEDHRVTVLGIAPTAVRALRSHGPDPVRQHDLSPLRVLGSTGEPWDSEAWRWLYREVGGERCPIINYSGGTETGGGILGCTTAEPVRECGFSGPVPGMDADVVDDNGQPLRGAVGELVVRQPWVGMTRGFWNDPERYLDTYWSRFPDTWVHGDWTEIDNDGFWHIRGRSDDVLKVAGKRIGPAEVESAACAHPAVQESAAIGVPHDLKGETLHLFVVVRPGIQVDESLLQDIRQTVGQHLGGSMRPERVHLISELPKTRNGKVMRRLIRAAYLGLPAGDATALENPHIIDEIASHARKNDRGE